MPIMSSMKIKTATEVRMDPRWVLDTEMECYVWCENCGKELATAWKWTGGTDRIFVCSVECRDAMERWWEQKGLDS